MSSARGPGAMWLCIAVAIAAPAVAWGQASSGAGITDDDDNAWSEGVSREHRQAARALFLEGNRLYNLQLFPRAIERYRAAVAKWPHPRFHYNLAIALLNQGDDPGARENFERAMQHGEGALGGDSYGEARRHRRDIEARLGRIRIVCESEGATITVNSADSFECKTGRDEWLVWVMPRSHELVARKTGHLTIPRTVEVMAGRVHSEVFSLVTIRQAADDSRRWAVWKPLSVIASGLVVVGAGVFVHSRAAADYRSYDDRFVLLDCVTEPDPLEPGCPPEAIPPELEDTLERANRRQAIAAGLYVAGGAVLAAGVTLQLLNRPRETREESARPRASETVTPIISHAAVGVSARFRF